MAQVAAAPVVTSIAVAGEPWDGIASAAQRIAVHHVGRAVPAVVVRLERKSEVVGVADARGSNIELTVSKARLAQVDANALESLALRLIDRHTERGTHRELAMCENKSDLLWLSSHLACPNELTKHCNPLVPLDEVDCSARVGRAMSD